MSQLLSRRYNTRALAIQALYAWHISDNGILRVAEDTLVDRDSDVPLDFEYYKTLVIEVAKNLSDVQAAFVPFLDRDVSKMTPIELSILRLAVYELLFQREIPCKVVINEAIELAKQFGAQSSHKYINGVLDKVSKTLV